MQASEFRIDTRHAAEVFDEKLKRYCSKEGIGQRTLLSLADAFEELAKAKHDRRCFSAYLDLYLQDVALLKDVNVINIEVYRQCRSMEVDGFFDIRMNLCIASSNVAHRIRAMWDKLMGLTVLLRWPDKYDHFCSSKSRLRSYERIARSLLASGSQELSQEDLQIESQWRSEIETIKMNVKFICDNYRTAEAHSISRLSKWAFTIQEDLEDPFLELIESSNAVRDHLRNISNLILFIRAWG